MAAEGCAESRLTMSRRAMLGVSASLFSWAYMPSWANAASSDPRLLVVILRGGMDGVNVCVPFGDKNYVKMRGGIAVPKSATIALDGTGGLFGLHPALKNFGTMYKAKEAAIVHACCVPLRNRSHFDCQDNLENGMPNNNDANVTGWLNRLLSYLPAGAPVKTHGAIQIGEAPLVLRGPAPVLGWSPTWFEKVQNPTLRTVRALYGQVDPEMRDVLDRGLTADRIATKAGAGGGDVSGLRRALPGAAAQVSAAAGPRLAVLSVDGWDTHADQGGANGYMADVLTELDLSINDFKATAGAAWKNTVVVCATEFGRTVHVNGDHGTDHGVGTTVLLAGGAVAGGHVFGDWPGIGQAQLYESSDLKPTTDLRSVFKGILRDHIGVVSNTALNDTIFPGSATDAPTMKKLIKSSAADAAPIAGGTRVPIRSEPAIARYRRGKKVTLAQHA
jgi:uncharacterized protein (DUF1501 family)